MPQEPPALTIERVVAAWGDIKKRARQRNGLLAACLQHFRVIRIQDVSGTAAVVIQADSKRHFDMVAASDRPRDIEWAISTEINQLCKVLLVPPGQH